MSLFLPFTLRKLVSHHLKYNKMKTTSQDTMFDIITILLVSVQVK